MGRLALVVALICAFAAGCGEEDAPSGTAQRTATPAATTTAATVDLEPFLLRDNEEPGFKRIDSPRTDEGLEAFLAAGDIPEKAARRLRRTGFVSFTYQPVVVDGGNAGVSNVHLFETPEGARDWLGWETSDEGIHAQIPDTKIKRFTVDGVPDARGWTGTDLHGNRIGHVYWVQGRCMMVIGNEGEGDFVEPLSTGATAIYERTNGECP